MVLTLAERSSLIAPSATLAMAAEARSLKEQGVDVLDFALGEPDFPTARQHPGCGRPGHEGGTYSLHPAGRHPRAQAGPGRTLHPGSIGLATQSAQVLVSNGAKHSIHNALMAVTGPGDEVIIPAPYWVSYADLVKLTGATPVVIETTEASGFKLTPDQFLGGRHAPDQALDAQQPVQPDRGGLPIGPSWRRWPTPS